MPSGLQHVLWESCAVEPVRDAELESYAKRKQGICLPAVPYFAPVPWLARALIDLRPEYGLLLHVEQDLVDLVSLIVSQENSCRYCYAGVRILLWAQGVSNEHLERIEQRLSRADLPERTVAAIAFGRAQSRAGPSVVRAARAALRTHGFDEDEIREIAYVVAETDFSNRAHTILAIPARSLEELPNRWYQFLSRPLVKRLLIGRHYRGHATSLDVVPSYPFAGIVEAYAGSPIGQALRETLGQMWASPHLTRRCKLLMLAVIARGLECEVVASELAHALEREGLDCTTLTEVLAHLDSPELNDCERFLVTFARETIWYEPAAVQRNARALRRTLSGPQLIEAVGVAALANGLCRLGTIVMPQP